MSFLKYLALAAALNGCFFVLAESVWAQTIFPDFEIEGDAVDDPAGSPDDWENIWDGPNSANASVFLSELFEGKGVDISYFTSGGSKDNQDISAWKITSNSAPDKNQMQNAYAAAYLCPFGGRPDCTADDLIVYLGADRYATAGDAQMGFWILRDQVSADIAGTKTFLNQFGDPAEHKDGDLLVQTDFTQGGTEFTIRVYFWDGDGLSGNGLTLLEEKINPFCQAQALESEDACGDLPQEDIISPWPYTNKKGTGTGAGGGADLIPAGGLFEARINVTRIFALQNLEVGCFSTFVAETRSSQSPTATLKDFALGSFNLCGITLDKTSNISQVCNLGGTTDIIYMYDVTNTGSIPLQVTLTDDEGSPGTDIDVIAEWEAQGGGANIADGTTPEGLRYVDVAGLGTAYFEIVLPVSGEVMNTAVATGNAGGATVMDDDTHEVTVVECTIAVTKDVDQTQVCSQDTDVTYDYSVTNTGDVTLIDVELWDDNGTISNDADDFLVATFPTLAPAATEFIDDFAKTLYTNTPGDVVMNTVVASGTPDGFPGVMVEASASASVEIFSCMIEITKVPNVLEVCAQNADVTYSYVVTNTGTAAIENLVVVDDGGTPGNPGDDVPITMSETSLAGGASAMATGSDTRNLSVLGPGDVTNIVTANATSLESFAVDEAMADATVTVHTCALSVTKTCEDAIGQNGDYGYHITVSNGGTVALNPVMVTDAKAGVSDSIPLAAGGFANYDGTYASGGKHPPLIL